MTHFKMKKDYLFDQLKILINDLTINSYMYQLVTFQRPYFAEGFANYQFLSSNLIRYTSKLSNNSLKAVACSRGDLPTESGVLK